MARWAVFDVDGTLLPKTSMEKWFITTVIKRGSLPVTNILFYFLSAMKLSITDNWEEAFKSNKLYLKDLLVQQVETDGENFFQKIVRTALSLDGIETVRKYRSSGYKILIMSGSPDFLTNHLQNIYFPDCLISTQLETKNASYTGNTLGLHPYGIRKTKILKNLQSELEIDFSVSKVFANHHADADHMALFGEVVAVNPTSKLARIANNKGWKVEMWE